MTKKTSAIEKENPTSFRWTKIQEISEMEDPAMVDIVTDLVSLSR